MCEWCEPGRPGPNGRASPTNPCNSNCTTDNVACYTRHRAREPSRTAAIQLGCLFECGEEKVNERIHLKVFALKELRPGRRLGGSDA